MLCLGNTTFAHTCMLAAEYTSGIMNSTDRQIDAGME